MAIGLKSQSLHQLLHSISRLGGRHSDGQLLESYITDRDEAAFETLMRRHGAMVLGVCRRVLGNCHDAEEAFQATWLVLLRKATSIRPRERVGNWLHGVALRTALRARSMNARRQVKEQELLAQHTKEDSEILDWLPILDQELSRLPEKYRVPVLLCELEGRTRKEVAVQLGWPEGTLSGRLARARIMLAKRLKRRGVMLSSPVLATAVERARSQCTVPEQLVAATKAAIQLAQLGGSAAPGSIPVKVVALSEAVARMMLFSKLKLGITCLLALGIVGGGAWAIPAFRMDRPARDPNSLPLGNAQEKNRPLEQKQLG